MEWPILTEVHFWAAPLRIGHHKEPHKTPPPPLPAPRFQDKDKMWEFKNRHTSTRHVNACLTGA